jgi:hypothetical protein
MRIILGSPFPIAMVALLVSPLAASDLEYPARPVKSFASYKMCLVALKLEQKKAKTTEKSYAEDKDDVVTRGGVAVSEIKFPSKNHAEFNISGWSTMIPKPKIGGDGSSFGWGEDWICKGRKMLKGGGHSAHVRIPAPPEPPPMPQMPPVTP